MTIQEAKDNLFHPVTVQLDADSFNGEILQVDDKSGLVQISFGVGDKGPFGWVYPKGITADWTGHFYDGPILAHREIDYWYATGKQPSVKAKTEYVGYNISEPVRVKLSPEAFQIWKYHDDNSVSDYPDIQKLLTKPIEKYLEKVDAEGYVEIPFYKLMQIFGNYCRLGCDVFDANILLPKNKIRDPHD
ncbi:hypothetical protein GO755_39035 [Spirosoma sp. HMF4905]|uniref:Uncharacterized protein n=1 Tax=Spirosoma arboris TaxID=2682092 RepID=A0A7K1SQI9_9BACT|nr:hypothetical protein [Spirosoma arboris]MVM36074.1 hypothetical protein [Spirosoma arboris]